MRFIFHVDLFFYVSLPFQMSVRAFHSVCPRAISPVRVTLFPSGILYITNILSRHRPNMSLCSKMNVEPVG